MLFTIYAGAVAYVYWSVKYRLGWKTASVRGIVAAVFALGLAAPQLIPSLSFMLASTRAALPFDKAGGGFALQDIALFALTGVINVWQPLYVGVATLVLAGAAIAARRFTQPRHDAWLWLGIGLSALALGFGANALGFDLAYLLAPGYRQFQSQERHALVVAFALSTLGAVGLQALLVPLRRRARLRLRRAGGWLAALAVAAFALLVAAQVIARLSEPRPESGPIKDSLALIAIALLVMAGLFAWRARLGRTPRWAWGAAVLALLAFDVITVDRYAATQKPAEPFAPPALLAPAQAQGGAEFFRIHNHFGLPLNAACVNGLLEIGGGSPIVLRDYQAFLARTPEDVYSRLLNVRYTATWRGGMGTQNGKTIPAQKLATAQFQGIDANLFQLDWPEPGLLPAWVASKITFANGEDELYRRMNADDFDPYREAVVYARDAGRIPATSSGDAGVEGRATGYLKVAVECARARAAHRQRGVSLELDRPRQWCGSHAGRRRRRAAGRAAADGSERRRAQLSAVGSLRRRTDRRRDAGGDDHSVGLVAAPVESPAWKTTTASDRCLCPMPNPRKDCGPSWSSTAGSGSTTTPCRRTARAWLFTGTATASATCGWCAWTRSPSRSS